MTWFSTVTNLNTNNNNFRFFFSFYNMAFSASTENLTVTKHDVVKLQSLNRLFMFCNSRLPHNLFYTL